MTSAQTDRPDGTPFEPAAGAPRASITLLLADLRAGKPYASRALYECAYDELRQLARSHRRRWNGNETLNTTAILHEAFIKLAGGATPTFENRLHFFATASMAMRQVLVNYAEHRRAVRSGGSVLHVELNDNTPLVADNAIDELLDLDKALRALEADSPRRGRIVECRLFGGMSVEETAAAMDISPATVKREWQVASALLFKDMASVR